MPNLPRETGGNAQRARVPRESFFREKNLHGRRCRRAGNGIRAGGIWRAYIRREKVRLESYGAQAEAARNTAIACGVADYGSAPLDGPGKRWRGEDDDFGCSRL